MSTDDSTKIVSKWYFGGVAASSAAIFTHPLDLLKVQLQTQQEEKLTAGQLTRKLIREKGIGSLFNGISASVLRQMTYSTVRFGVYEAGKQHFGNGDIQTMDFSNRVLLAGAGGLIGGFIGTPADIITVRMQNDPKLPVDQQRNYKNAFDGLYRVYKEEGVRRLFTGASTHIARSVTMTIGQLTIYDEVKNFLLQHQFKDNLSTHFLSSLTAGAMATTLSQPIDVIKTRAMNARPGQFPNIWAVVVYTAKLGPKGFYKGYLLRFIRLAPHTVLTFIFLEQFRLHFGTPPKEKSS
uniref:CSON011969 protein n=1 Tax=Culicoides sonorensis TaxID=179676 RepID=A0A336M4F2_CULSO